MAGPLNSFAIKKDGTLWAWGENGNGQLGLGHNKDCNSPTKVESLSQVKQVAAGNRFSLFLKDDGTVWACGINKEGQLGVGHKNECDTLQQVPKLTNVKHIIAGHAFGIAIKRDGDIWVSGNLTGLASIPSTFFTPHGALNQHATMLRKRVTFDTDKLLLRLASELVTELFDKLNKFINKGFLLFATADEQQLILARGLKQFIEHNPYYHLVRSEIEAYAECNQKRPSSDQLSFAAILKEMLQMLNKAKELYIDRQCIEVMESSSVPNQRCEV